MHALPDSHWRTLVWMMKRAKSSFRLVADHSVLSHLHLVKKLVPFTTFTSARPDNPSTFNAQFLEVSPLGRMFSSLPYWWWVLFRCSSRENVNICLTMRLSYIFCFPTIGVDVPICPGDYLLFNARIPHCIFSRCKVEEEILVTSAYLKMAVVGINNNDLPFTDKQQAMIIEKFI